MAERLGHLLYWIGLLAAAGFFLFGIWVIVQTGENRIGFWAFVMAPVPVAWGFGRACRYILAGS